MMSEETIKLLIKSLEEIRDILKDHEERIEKLEKQDD